MKVIITRDYEEMSEKALEIMLGVVKENPCAVLGLATGTTPLGLYERMITDRKENGTSYKHIKAVNLDEYMGLTETDEQSYVHFMRKNLFGGIDIDLENTYIEDGAAENAEEECKRYDGVLSKFKRDIQLLGLGSNGHIAFNEPGTPFETTTHVVKLADSTVKDNARLFKQGEKVPSFAYTMGVKSIMDAEKILVLASGANKAEAVYGMVKGAVSEKLPASILQTHPDCTLIVDEAAAELI